MSSRVSRQSGSDGPFPVARTPLATTTGLGCCLKNQVFKHQQTLSSVDRCILQTGTGTLKQTKKKPFGGTCTPEVAEVVPVRTHLPHFLHGNSPSGLAVPRPPVAGLFLRAALPSWRALAAGVAGWGCWMTRVRGRAPAASSGPFMMRTVPGCKAPEEVKGETKTKDWWEGAGGSAGLAQSYRLTCGIMLQSLRRLKLKTEPCRNFDNEYQRLRAEGQKKWPDFFAVLIRFARQQELRSQNESAGGGRAETLSRVNLARVQRERAGSQEASQHRLTSYT